MLGRLALVVASLLFTLLVGELAARLVRGPATLLSWKNLILEERRQTLIQGEGRLLRDPGLGYVARPGYAKDGLSYDREGYRTMPAAPVGEAPILVVGDSYAHGDEVADNETWPARLQERLKRPVVNAALSGYGLDQIVLRAEREAAKLKPAAIVLSFIADDLRRAEMKRLWGAEKPWFDLRDAQLQDGRLELRNVPVPPAPDPASTLDIWQWLFGWSIGVDTLLRHKGWQYEWSVDHERVMPRGAGDLLACPLMKRLAALGLPVLVVAEHDPYGWKDAEYRDGQRARSNVVLRCAEQAGFASLDLFDTMDEGVRSFGYAKVFRTAHPSPLGAELATRRIAEEIEAKKLLK